MEIKPLFKEEIMELENKKIKYNQWDATKIVLRGKCIALNVFSGKEHWKPWSKFPS